MGKDFDELLCRWDLFWPSVTALLVRASDLQKPKPKSRPERIEWFIEAQAFLTVVWLGTPTKRQVSKRPVSKRPQRQVYKTSSTSGLQNVRITKRQVYKTSGHQTFWNLTFCKPWRFVNLTFWNRTFWNKTFGNLNFWNLTFCGCTYDSAPASWTPPQDEAG